MKCPYCNQFAVKNGTEKHSDGKVIQTYRCKACQKYFNERTATPMARLRTPTATVSRVLKVRTEGLGVRATGRAFDLSHLTIMRWEQRIANKEAEWSPSVPENHDIIVEGDELYTRVERNFPPQHSQGWTINFLERNSRYWLVAKAGKKDEQLFKQATHKAWEWAA